MSEKLTNEQEFAKNEILSSFENYKNASLNEKTKELEILVDSINNNWFLIENNQLLTAYITEKIIKELDFSDLNPVQEKIINDFYNKQKENGPLGALAKELKNKIYDDHMETIKKMPVDKINFSKLILSIEVIRESMIEKDVENVDKNLSILLNRFDFSKLTLSEVAEISEPDSLSPIKKRKLSDNRHRKMKNFLFDKYLEDQCLAGAELLAKQYPKSEPVKDFLFHLKLLRHQGEVVNLKNAAVSVLDAYDKKPNKNKEKKYVYIKEMIAFLPKKVDKKEVTREIIIDAIAKNCSLTSAELLKRLEDEKSHSSLFNFNDILKRVKKVALTKRELKHRSNSPGKQR